MVNPSRRKFKQKRGEKEKRTINAKGSQNNEGMADPSHQKFKQTLWESKEQRRMNARVSKNNAGLVNLRHQNVKQKAGENKGLLLVGNQEQIKINASGIQNNEEMVNPSHQKLKPKIEENQVSRGVRGSIPGMEPGLHRGKGHMIFDHSMKSKNPSRIWYSGSGPGKAVFEGLDSQKPSTNHDRHPINKERGYLRFQDKESVIHEDNVTMENLCQEDHQEHEVNSPQTNTVTSARHQENIASNSNGTTITRKESRALSANRKSRFNQRKLVFEIDDCAGRIVGDDSQTFITKGGCVVRECAVFDGRTWKKQPDLLKEDIISKTTEHSDFKPTCPLLARAIKTQLASHHRTRQYILHKHYLKYPTKEEATTHPPNGVKVAEWVLLCDRFASEEFQKISATNKQNRACNEVPPIVGTKSVARRIHMKRKRGKEVMAIGGYKIAHWSKKKKAMINDKATEIWSDLQNEEASSSCTPAEICIEKLGHISGHIRGHSASTKHVFETESLRMDLNSEKEKSKQLEKDHLELKENHLKLPKEHVSLTKKVNYLLKHFTPWQSQENEDYDTEDYEDYDEAQDDGM